MRYIVEYKLERGVFMVGSRSKFAACIIACPHAEVGNLVFINSGLAIN